ncbi:MAG: succinate dehydrogenase, hydrophobic membrane anchor protein [Candidatus Midichloria sp.]|uniref:Succinate dehydrogenase, hydrophobic membrane anchor protein n=1 Tax=Hyalomma marginatum TaxID=34627 RepID=A0A8S4C1R4_9ACAR|nr:succinate dehydrogenase, hydrophobic membrane anchor protein [Hyalomma marginatum]CAG7593326.1 succinate dehydrogenase, hydrophobic membrane anchor protein [Hyalomma marginatum]
MSNLSSKSAVNHYITQRLTAIVLIPIAVWFIVVVFKISKADSLAELGEQLLSPFNMITAILFVIAALYHGLLGTKEIVTDYIHCPALKKVLVSSLVLVTIISAIAGIFSLVYFFIMLKIFFPC